MKRLILSLIVLFFATAYADAQITGGGGVGISSQVSAIKKKKGVFNNHFNISFIRSVPSGAYGTAPKSSEKVWEDGHFGVKAGFGGAVGQTFYFKNLSIFNPSLNDKLKLGLDATYFSVIANWNNKSENINSANCAFIAVKAGPIISYNPINKWLLSAKLTFEPTIYMYDINSDNPSTVSWDEFFLEGQTFMLRTTFGLRAKYRPLLVGVDFSFGGKKDEEAYLETNAAMPDYVKISTTRIDFVVGLSF